jgi:Uma2 family endonuclease
MTASLSTSLAAGKIMLTYEDYACLPEDGNRYEVIAGTIETTPTPSPRHQDISGNLQFKLKEALASKGKILAAPCDLILGEHDIVQPDLIYVSAEKKHIIGKQNIQGVPDLLIEILSPSTRRRDVLIKSRLYAKHGVPHYWIVDPDLNRIETFALNDDVYALTRTFNAPETMTPEGFPELVLPLDYIFLG